MVVSQHLLHMFANKIQLQYGKIKTAMFFQEFFQTSSNHSDFTSLKNETELCIQLGECDYLFDKLKSIGMVYRETI